MRAINYTIKDIWTGRKAEMNYTPNLQDAWDWRKSSDKFNFVADMLGFSGRDAGHVYFDAMLNSQIPPSHQIIDIVEAAYRTMIQEFNNPSEANGWVRFENRNSIVIMDDVTAAFYSRVRN